MLIWHGMGHSNGSHDPCMDSFIYDIFLPTIWITITYCGIYYLGTSVTKTLSPTTYVLSCKSSSFLGLLLANEAWTITGMVVRGLIKLLFSSLGWLSYFEVTTALKSFLYLPRCALSVPTDADKVSHLILFNRWWTFVSRSRTHSCSWFSRIIWYLTWWDVYFSKFHALFLP